MPMNKLNKAVESICEDCMFWIQIENCRACLYNALVRDKPDNNTDWEKVDYKK